MILDKDNCFYLGKITKSKGVRGLAYAFFDVDNLGAYSHLKSALIEIHGALQPIFFTTCELQSGKVLLGIDGVNSDAELKPYINKDLYLPLNALPKLKGNKFYFHEVIDFTVIDATLGEIGKVQEVYDSEVNPLLAILHSQGKEVLLPISDAIIKNVNRSSKTIEVDAPEGLVQMYLE